MYQKKHTANLARLRALSLLTAALTASASLQAQTRLTLEQCREQALSRNAQVRQAQGNVAAADQQRKEAFTSYFPKIDASAMAFTANKGLVAIPLGEATMEMVDDGTLASVSAVQPVFAGGQIVNGNRLARVGADVSRLQLRQTEDEVVKTVEQYYWQAVTLREKMRTVEVVDSLLARLETDVQTAVKAGVRLRNDLLQVQLRRNDVAASRASLESGIALAEMLLAQYVGCGTEGGVQPVAAMAMGTMPEAPLALRTDHQAALGATAQYGLLQKNVEAADLQRRLAVGKNLPQVGVGAGYSYNNLMDDDRSLGLVFASVKVPLSDWWGGSHAIKRRRIEADNARIQLEDNSQLLVIGMQNAWNELQTAYDQVGLACRSLEQSGENLRLNTDFYRAGTSTMSDLMDAQALYQQSRDRYVEAFADYQNCRTSYLVATGRADLLGR